MKRFLLITAVLALFCSCQDKYAELKEQVNALESRMSELSSILDNAIAKSMTVTVTEVEGGHKLTFSDGTFFVVNDGNPGAPGAPGVDLCAHALERDEKPRARCVEAHVLDLYRASALENRRTHDKRR